MMAFRRLLGVVILVLQQTVGMAQFGFITPTPFENAHIKKIDSIDIHKADLNEFKKLYEGDSAVKVLDTTFNYVLFYSDTVKYDKSERRLYYGDLFNQDTLYRMDSLSNLYYRSKTFKHNPKVFTARQILEKYAIRDMFLVPAIIDSTSSASAKVTSKTYYDHFTPYTYNNKVLVLQQHHGYFGYNHVGIVNFSNYVNHYFIITP